MRRIFIILIVVALILLPFVFWVFTNPNVALYFQKVIPLDSRTTKSALFSVSSQVPGVTIKLADTKYLDFVTQNMGIFNENAVVDPRTYRGFPNLQLRYTVTHIRFILVPTIDQFLLAISGDKDFAGRGVYSIDGDTLVVRISLNFDEVGGVLSNKNSAEDVFLQTALQTLYYAHGLSDPITNSKAFEKIKQDIQNYIYSGLISWPIQIMKV